MLDFSSFAAITFDCYGTLVDWRRSVTEAMQALLSTHGLSLAEGAILVAFGLHESRGREGAYRPYAEILADTVRGFGEQLDFAPSAEETASLAQAVAASPPFPDTVPALSMLKQRYRLGIISNIDDALFARTARRLEVPFDVVMTAEQARCYKPAAQIFQAALARLGCQPAEVLHVGQWLEGDVIPAKALGMATVWVRRSEETSACAGSADLQVPDLEALVEAMDLA